ncbi:hypothetical protein TIFTF001_017158 [Ficus carica]|uniref:Uncharacterized protein n=1 Tax=Ficus carica TaxID=3494 RepID=A0AA88AQB2_FICCA|nr:hypothetical protein TIFTF001_017158 [Ficus carica]
MGSGSSFKVGVEFLDRVKVGVEFQFQGQDGGRGRVLGSWLGSKSSFGTGVEVGFHDKSRGQG